jgi:hypothetical protein
MGKNKKSRFWVFEGSDLINITVLTTSDEPVIKAKTPGNSGALIFKLVLLRMANYFVLMDAMV